MAIRYYVSTEEASFFNNNRMGYADSIPNEGNYKVGDFIISSTQENGVFGWVCTVAGNPGEWEVIGSGAADENKVVGYVNAVSFSDTRNSIEIGIDEYKKGKDFLEVHYNGLLLAEGVHYNVSADGKSIVAIDGDWNENANDTQQMIFRVLRSNVSVIEPTDGSVTIDKLSNDIKEDLAAIDGLIASVNTQNTTISNINDRVGVLEAAEEIDLSGYQGKNDGNLATTNKTIVGAINELFQSANNGKQLIASAIGEPLSATDTFSAMRNEIEEMLEYFRDKLRSVGVTDSLDNLKLKELIDKVNIQYYSFSITKKLTNCTINNDATIVNRNSSYSATITADTNSVMQSITVTMGGVDITNAVVTGYNINITSVTGDIVITANASS